MNMKIRLSLTLICIKCTIVEGTPISKEHSKLIWLKRENLNSLKWAPADIPAVKQLIVEKLVFSFEKTIFYTLIVNSLYKLAGTSCSNSIFTVIGFSPS